MDLASDTRAVLLAAGLIFLWALVLGVWKYRGMATSEEGLAHPYVDTAHRPPCSTASRRCWWRRSSSSAAGARRST